MCSICSNLGIGLDSHMDDDCWINPASKSYKPETRQYRLLMVLDHGLVIPEDNLVMAPFVPRKTTKSMGTNAMVTTGEA